MNSEAHKDIQNVLLGQRGSSSPAPPATMGEASTFRASNWFQLACGSLCLCHPSTQTCWIRDVQHTSPLVSTSGTN